MIGLIETLESVQYGILLTESARIDFLVKTYGARLATKWEATHAAEPGNIQAEVTNEPGEDVGVKLLNFILSHDPTRAQTFTQWMVNRYLKNAIRLEDLDRASSYLAVFDRAKSRIKPADINAYKDVPSLFQAVRPFIEQGEAVSARDESNRADRRMHQEDQATIVLNNETLKIVIPHTEQASCYFGRNTQWCTAATSSSNYFDSYNSRGSLYIILEKATNRRWQWHFEDSQFLDEHDGEMSDPSFIEFVRAHREIIRAIGEERFLHEAARIGLEYFSPKLIKKIGLVSAASQVTTKDAYLHVPAEIRNDPTFISLMIENLYESIQWVPDEYLTDAMLEERIPTHRGIFRYIPKHRLTQEMVHLALPTMSHMDIDELVPTPLKDHTVRQAYYGKAARAGRVRLNGVPSEFVTPEVCEICVAKNANDLKYVPEDVLTREFANDVAKLNADVLALLPPTLLSPELCIGRFDEFMQHPYNRDKLAFLKRAPSASVEQFPPEMIQAMIKNGWATFKTLPDAVRRQPKVLISLIKSSPNEGVQGIPAEYLTPEVVGEALTYSNVKSFPKAALTPEAVAEALKDNILIQHIADALPKAVRTPPMMAVLVRAGCVPVKNIPANLRSEAAVIGRIAHGDSLGKTHRYHTGSHKDEIADIPPTMWTQEFADALVREFPGAIHEIPDTLASEANLHHAMGGWDDDDTGYAHGRRPAPYGYQGPEQTELKTKFAAKMAALPQEKWTSRMVWAALSAHYMEPHIAEVPERLMTPKIAEFILHRHPEEFEQLPASLQADNDFIARCVHNTHELLDHLRPDQITDAVAHEAVAGNASIKYGDSRKLLLAHLDKTRWPAKTWDAAVGYIADLGEVPPKFRTPELVKNAITRDPSNVAYLDDPAGYMKANNITIDKGDKTLRQKLEDNGIVFQGNKMTNVRDAGQTKVEGGSYVEIRQGPSNVRVYVFDESDKLVCRLATQNGEIKVLTTYGRDYRTDTTAPKPDADLIKAVANASSLKDYNVGEIESLDVYKSRKPTYAYDEKGNYGPTGAKQGYYTEDEAEKTDVDGLTWSEIATKGGTIHTLWNGSSPALRLETTTPASSWGNRNPKEELSSSEANDLSYCFEQVSKIFKYVENKITPRGSRGLNSIGIITTKKQDKRILLRGKKVADYQGMTVWLDSSSAYVSVFNENGLVGYGVLRKGGQISNVTPQYGSGVDHDQIEPLMVKIATVLSQRAHSSVSGGSASGTSARPRKTEPKKTEPKKTEPTKGEQLDLF